MKGKGKGARAVTMFNPHNLSGKQNAPHFRDQETEVREDKGTQVSKVAECGSELKLGWLRGACSFYFALLV